MDITITNDHTKNEKKNFLAVKETRLLNISFLKDEFKRSNKLVFCLLGFCICFEWRRK